jgi:hypothetical protein
MDSLASWVKRIAMLRGQCYGYASVAASVATRTYEKAANHAERDGTYWAVTS